jgi:hypothetical protein
MLLQRPLNRPHFPHFMALGRVLANDHETVRHLPRPRGPLPGVIFQDVDYEEPGVKSNYSLEAGDMMGTEFTRSQANYLATGIALHPVLLKPTSEVIGPSHLKTSALTAYTQSRSLATPTARPGCVDLTLNPRLSVQNRRHRGCPRLPVCQGPDGSIEKAGAMHGEREVTGAHETDNRHKHYRHYGQ